ncbi:MAG: insulinase family protein [Verrucomicrobia bacterium]|nr:insulinase family protein [Verrucomicrobiota bacterium]
MRLTFNSTTLPGGLRVATAEMPGIESVAMGIWAGVGSRYETARRAGVCHFIEHMLFKGTTSRSARAISQAIEGRGGYFNGFTQEETTCYYARIAAEYQWEALDILFDMYRHPRLDSGDLEKERGVILEEIAMYHDQPHQLVQEILGSLAWVDHPLGRPLVGTEDNVREIRRQDILAFKTSHYVTANTLVALAGKVDHDACVERAAQALGGLSRRSPPSCERVGRSVRQRDVAVHAKEVEQPHIAMAFRLFGRHDSRRYALKLLSIILGENMSSRLFQIVREKHGLAYSIQSSVQLFDETGLLCVQAGVDRNRVSRALDLILAEIRRFREVPVGARELRRAKDFARGQLRIGLESASNQMMWVGENLLCYNRLIQPAEVLSRIESVSASDILKVARGVLDRRRLSVAMVSPGDATRHTDLIRGKIARLG